MDASASRGRAVDHRRRRRRRGRRAGGAVRTEDSVPSDRFGGLWGSGQRDGFWLVALHLIEYGGGIERQWFTDNIDRPLLETILDVPHLVALVPRELAGDAETLEDVLPRLGGAVIFEVADRSPQVAQILAERNDDAD
jgi:hypothetical protein